MFPKGEKQTPLGQKRGIKSIIRASYPSFSFIIKSSIKNLSRNIAVRKAKAEKRKQITPKNKMKYENFGFQI